MKRYNIRPAVAADIKAFYDVMPVSMQAIVMEDRGKLIGIAGITVEKNRMLAISKINEFIPAKAIWRGVIAFREMMKTINSPIIALREKEYCNAHNFLERVGFKYSYTIPEGDIYICQMH